MLEESQESPISLAWNTPPANPGSISCTGRTSEEATVSNRNSGQMPLWPRT